MVCAGRYSGDFRPVFSRARSAARLGAQNDARSRRRDAGVVHEVDPARGRARLQLRLPSSTQQKWQQVFGQTSDEETPDFYRPRPFSRSYVVHLDDWYAQSHPDEDFAETFAVWLTPGLDWRKRYAGWKALQKLEYVDELMRPLGGKTAAADCRDIGSADYNCLNLKLKTYYARKRKLYEDTYPGFLRHRSATTFRRARPG